MRRILIFGNSGSGKSTLASKIAGETGFPHLDLDVLAWESPGVRKDVDETLKEVQEFIETNEDWIIEGCYGSLLQEVANYRTELHFLNPGIEACLKNNLLRPGEPHKYESVEAQNKNLDMLQEWVKEYEEREDEYSLKRHRKVFEEFNGHKKEYSSQ